MKTVHELMITLKPEHGQLWNKRRTKALQKDEKLRLPVWDDAFKGAKCCLFGDVNEKINFPFFKSTNIEKRARQKSWCHQIAEGFLSNFPEYNFTISSLTELFQGHSSVKGYPSAKNKDGRVVSESVQEHLAGPYHMYMLRFGGSGGVNPFKIDERLAELKPQVEAWKQIAEDKLKDTKEQQKLKASSFAEATKPSKIIETLDVIEVTSPQEKIRSRSPGRSESPRRRSNDRSCSRDRSRSRHHKKRKRQSSQEETESPRKSRKDNKSRNNDKKDKSKDDKKKTSQKTKRRHRSRYRSGNNY